MGLILWGRGCTSKTNCRDFPPQEGAVAEEREERLRPLEYRILGLPKEKELAISELQEKCEQLERELFKANENLKSFEGKKFPKRSKDESERMI